MANGAKVALDSLKSSHSSLELCSPLCCCLVLQTLRLLVWMAPEANAAPSFTDFIKMLTRCSKFGEPFYWDFQYCECVFKCNSPCCTVQSCSSLLSIFEKLLRVK